VHANECLIRLRPWPADEGVMAHRLAVVCAAALLAGSILAGCAGFGDTTTTVVAPTVTVPGSSDTTTFSGTTEQGLPFVFAATPSAVVQLSFDWRAPCADGEVRSNSIRLGAASIQEGSFSFDSTLETRRSHPGRWENPRGPCVGDLLAQQGHLVRDRLPDLRCSLGRPDGVGIQPELLGDRREPALESLLAHQLRGLHGAGETVAEVLAGRRVRRPAPE
jgi:hypothetical protein